MPDLRTRIADLLNDHGLRGWANCETTADAILDLVAEERAS